MSEFLNIKKIIEVIPDILIYFAPGFIFLTLRNYHISSDIDKDKYVVVKSVVISYLFIKLVNIKLPLSHKFFTYIVLGLSIVTSLIYIRWDLESKLIKKLNFSKSTNKDYMQDIINVNEGAWVYLYLPKENAIYYGKLIYYENTTDGKDKNIVISNFCAVSYDGDEIVNHEEDNNWQIILNTKDISRIEIYK